MCVTQTQLTFPPSHFVFLWWIQSLLKTQKKSFYFSSCIKRNPKVRENITFCVVPSSQKRKRTNSLVISSCYRSAIAKVWRKCPACTSPGTECLPEPPRVQPALLISLQFLKSLSLFGIRPSKRTDWVLDKQPTEGRVNRRLEGGVKQGGGKIKSGVKPDVSFCAVWLGLLWENF